MLRKSLYRFEMLPTNTAEDDIVIINNDATVSYTQS